MRVTKVASTRQCAVCERTLLMGERAVSFAPSEGAELVDVCPLCQELATEAGWIKEGAPTTPTLENGRRRRRKRNIVEFLGLSRDSRRGRAGSARADPAQALRRRGRAARGRRPLQRQRLPPHRRRHRQEPRRAEREHRPALWHVRRAGRDRRLGAVLVPVPRQPRLRHSPCGSSAAATSSKSSTRASRTGTRRSRTRVASSPRSRAFNSFPGTSRA